MKFFKIFILSLFYITSYSQNTAEFDKLNKKLIGTWKCDGIEILNLLEYINQTMEITPDSIKAKVNLQIEGVVKQMIDTMNFCTFIFNEDHTMKSIFHYKTSNGKWQFSKDGKELITTEEETQKEIKYRLMKLKKKTLIIYNYKRDIKVKMGFIKII